MIFTSCRGLHTAINTNDIQSDETREQVLKQALLARELISLFIYNATYFMQCVKCCVLSFIFYSQDINLAWNQNIFPRNMANIYVLHTTTDI